MDSARLTVRLTPRADRDAVVGFEGDGGAVLRVRVTAPPVDGRANAALVRVLAARLGVPAADLRVAVGQGARTKVVVVDGLMIDEVRARLEA